MTTLSRILPLDNILLDLDVTSKKRVFEQASLLFENNHGLTRSIVFDSIFERERLGSTALGHGVAIPHGRIKTLSHPICAFIRLKKGILFDAPDNQPVNILFFLLVPEKATQQHLDILAAIAQLLSSDEVQQQLNELNEIQTIHELLTKHTHVDPSDSE